MALFLNVHILGFINKLDQEPISDLEKDHAPGGRDASYNDL